MPELVYALICSDLIIDKDSNSTSFIRTVEHAVVQDFPAHLPPIYFASLWDLEGSGGQPFTISLALTAPSGESVTLGVQEVPGNDTMLHKMNFHLPGLTVQEEGKHVLSVNLKDGDNWLTCSNLPFYVFKTENQ